MDWPDISSLDAYYIFQVEPVAASRPRIRVIGKNRTMAYYSGKYKTFKEVDAPNVVKLCVDKNFQDKPLALWVTFAATKPRTSKLEKPGPDIDNYLKAIFDVLNGELWYDDKQIVEVHATKQWSSESYGYIKLGLKVLE